MSLFHPQIEAGYPDNCITVDDAVSAIKQIYRDKGFRVEALEIKCVTNEGNKLRLAFDRKNVGQPHSVETR